MTARAGLTIILFYVVGLLLIAVGPKQVLAILIVVAPALVGAGVASTVYLEYVYRRQPPPRSRFFAMLIHAQAFKVMASVWILYSTIVSLILFVHPDLNLPILPQPYRSAVTALSIASLMLPSIYYAVRIYLARRRAGKDEGEDRG